MTRAIPKLCIVLPCYNEEEVLPSTIERLREKLQQLIADGLVTAQSRVLFVDDGSKDATWRIISTLAHEDELFEGVKLAHNRGHQNALLAGLDAARSSFDAVVSMDADLQDDPNVIDEMVEHYCNGANIVLGVRDDRSTDTAFKRGTAGLFYKFMRAMGADTVDNHADFRLMDTQALDALFEYAETNLFLRGVIVDIGLNVQKVFYKRGERQAGESKYPLHKMIAFATNGITSFSIRPLRMIGVVGAIAILVSIVAIVYSLIQTGLGNVVSGWPTLICSIWFIGGVQLLCLSVLGEYIGKIYQETKARPRYLIQENTLKR